MDRPRQPVIRVAALAGEELQPHLAALAGLRIAVFRDYPYLYDGDEAYEAWYLADFARAPGAVVIAAFDDGRLVGAATASPMRAQKQAFSAPLARLGVAVEDLFYFGESVLLPDYRGLGLGHRFFDAREQATRGQGFGLTGFYAVIRPPGHPLRPQAYSPLDPFWRKRGYAPLDAAVAVFPWKELGEAEETDHPMQFWMRAP
jgi:GNAT superfamily N-acetyltransferase